MNAIKQNYEPAILWPGLFIGLCAVHPLFIFGVFYSAYKYREPWIKQINLQLATYKWWYFSFPVFAFVMGYLNVMPFAPDDLLRHVVAYKFSYNYHSLFIHTPLLPTFNLWIGFEIVAGKFHELLGPEYSVRAIQAIAVALFYTSFFLALHKILKEREDKWLWCTIIFALCASPLSYRIFSGRPDIFFTAWLISAVFLRPIIWLIIGIIFTPTYWLAIIYAPGALLLSTTWRNRIIYAALFSITCFVFWHVYSKGEWVNSLLLISKWTNNRIIDTSELVSSIYMLGDKYLLGLLILLFYSLYRASFKLMIYAIPLYLLIIYFLLPNYIRYMIIVVPLIGLLCALYLPKNVQLPPTASLVVLILSSLIVSKATPHITTYEQLPKFNIPYHATVLTQFDEGLYSGILHNPNVKFSPAMEIGATDKTVQALAKNLRQGAVDCQELKKFTFTHIQEDKLKTIPPCLNLFQVNGSWRLWEIR